MTEDDRVSSDISDLKITWHRCVTSSTISDRGYSTPDGDISVTLHLMQYHQQQTLLNLSRKESTVSRVTDRQESLGLKTVQAICESVQQPSQIQDI